MFGCSGYHYYAMHAYSCLHGMLCRQDNGGIGCEDMD